MSPRRSSLSPRAALVVTTLFLAFALLMTTGLTWSTVQDSRGADADATFVKTNVDTRLRRYYTVRFVTRAGQNCESVILSNATPPRPVVLPGDPVRVHYLTNGRPCDTVREAGGGPTWLFAGAAWLGLSLMGLLTYRTWRRTTPVTIAPLRPLR